MRRLALFVPWVMFACGKPVSMTGAEVEPSEGTTELRLSRDPLPIEFTSWELGAPVDFTLASGAGAPSRVRLRPPTQMLNLYFGGSFEPVRWAEATVFGENALVTLEGEEQVLLVDVLGEGEFTVTLVGEYRTSSAARKPTARPIWLQLHGTVREAQGWRVDTSCEASDEVLVAPGRHIVPRVSAVDAAGTSFDALNHPALTLRSDAPIVSPRSRAFSFVGEGEVWVGLETSAPVAGLKKVRVTGPAELSALKLSGALLHDDASPTTEVRAGTVAQLGQVVVAPGAQPYWAPRVLSTTSHGAELCTPPAPASFELESLTPDVCTPERVGGELVVGAHLLRAGHCSLRLHVLGNARLTTGFEFDVQLP